MKSLNILYNDNSQLPTTLEVIPDKCPVCHRGTDPHIHFGFCDKNKWNLNDCLQVVYRCTFKDCQSLFIAYYRSRDQGCSKFPTYTRLKPVNKASRDFSDVIKEISPSFITIYNQAYFAEQDGLSEICGAGYRKALEFLIKDYLISLDNNKEEIERMFLGNCIKEKVGDPNIKAMAERATWLGNDETHYKRTWEDKDLSDMKKLIDATLAWIKLIKLTEEVQEEMPNQ